MKKVLYFDTETTGLDPVRNDIIQLAGLVEIDGEIKDEFNIRCLPFSFENISPEALEVHGITIEELKKYQSPQSAYREFMGVLSKHCNKFDRSDKFYPAGFQVNFDINFLSEWFKKNGDTYLGSWLNWKAIDPLSILRWFDYMGIISLPSYKLEKVCEHYGIEIDAHDALSDIKATREVMIRLVNLTIFREQDMAAGHDGMV